MPRQDEPQVRPFTEQEVRHWARRMSNEAEPSLDYAARLARQQERSLWERERNGMPRQDLSERTILWDEATHTLQPARQLQRRVSSSATLLRNETESLDEPSEQTAFEDNLRVIAENTAASTDIPFLSGTLLDLEQIKDDLEAKLKQLNEGIDRLNGKLRDEMLSQEVSNIQHKGHTFYLNTRTFVSPKAEQKEAFYQWLKENGFEDMVKEQVNANTLSSWYKEQSEAMEDPEVSDVDLSNVKEMLNIHEKTSVGIRKR